jgi:hypothetical protein
MTGLPDSSERLRAQPAILYYTAQIPAEPCTRACPTRASDPLMIRHQKIEGKLFARDRLRLPVFGDPPEEARFHKRSSTRQPKPIPSATMPLRDQANF